MATYLSTYVRVSTYALTVNGVEVGALLEKLRGSTKAIEKAIDEALRRDKVEAGTKG